MTKARWMVWRYRDGKPRKTREYLTLVDVGHEGLMQVWRSDREKAWKLTQEIARERMAELNDWKAQDEAEGTRIPWSYGIEQA